MYAIVEIGGQQFKVSKDDVIVAPKISDKEGEKVVLDKVLLTSGEKGVKVGNPVIKGVKVKATVIENEHGKKVIVFKKKRRKGYQVKRGHKQEFSRIKIDDIVLK
ncbi:50S ribosomal protein L21 [candidate division KSB1 bacterium 4572_119]|nr:MAG: 50S ribosomal protein L21 [candidate division KSB1 bacterium 4572_119]